MESSKNNMCKEEVVVHLNCDDVTTALLRKETVTTSTKITTTAAVTCEKYDDHRVSHFSAKMNRAKMTSFLYYGGKYVLMTFLVPYLISIGLNTGEAGVILGARYAVQVLGALVLGALVDHTKRHALITCVSIAISIGCILMTSLSPLIVGLPVEYRGVKNASVPHEVNGAQRSQNMFIVAMAFCSIYAFFDGGLNGIVDVCTIAYCDKIGKANSYYWQRLWGSIGYSCLPLAVGFTLSYLNVPYISPYLPVIIIFFMCQCLLVPPFLSLIRGYQGLSQTNNYYHQIPTAQEEKQALKEQETRYSKNVTLTEASISSEEKAPFDEKPITNEKDDGGIFKLLATPDIALCLFLQVLFGMGAGVEFSYLLIFMEEHMVNATTVVFGLAVFSQSLAEALTAPFIGAINRALKDPYLCISLGVLGYGGAFFAYFHARNALLIVGVNVLFGVSYTIFNFTAQNECFKKCPQRSLTLLFSLSASCYTGVGCGVGSVLGGLMYETIGPRAMYLVTSITFVVIAFFILILCAARVLMHHRRNKEKDSLLTPVHV